MLAATRPTNPAAIHSIVSMKRSIEARFISAPRGLLEIAANGGGMIPPPQMKFSTTLLREGVIFGERGLQLCQCRVGIGAVFLDTVGPGLDQRLGRLLSQRRLVPGQPVHFP